MAKTKKTAIILRQERYRTSWIPFRLTQEQHGLNWPEGHWDTYLTSLVDVAGCLKVKVGRKVDDPEQAVLIIGECNFLGLHIVPSAFLTHGGRRLAWDSADDLNKFQQSTKCRELLHTLGYDENKPSSQLLSLRWEIGFCIGDASTVFDKLHGRVTLTTLTIPYSGTQEFKSWTLALRNAFGRFLPKVCEPGRLPPCFRWWSYTWVDDHDSQQDKTEQQSQESEQGARESPLVAVADEQSQATCYLFFRWNGRCATPEVEEKWAADAEEQKLWAAAVEAAMPPVAAWKKERWHIHIAPRYMDDEEIDFEE
ncbi:hypothetical protein S7711_11527 [Stachybotrys chartarum IBT 7711]|uniref:Uncharacterized protein n=1 Tax=Stachybotrys chartarum (strain CBS 109288 / IBT 7711) TaxID=1280523 RepID=A0A084AEY3_STACB|nr:hypothetical protein S7711_11527 [Stachybotrys chartarum IBT 7711]